MLICAKNLQRTRDALARLARHQVIVASLGPFAVLNRADAHHRTVNVAIRGEWSAMRKLKSSPITSGLPVIRELPRIGCHKPAPARDIANAFAFRVGFDS
jgi:hypothetical protein